MILPYGELITKVLVYSDFDLDEEELEIKHSKVGKSIFGQRRYVIQGREIVALPPKAL